MKATNKGNEEVKSGIFITFSIALLLISIIWLRYFAIGPAKKIILEFKDPGPVDSGMAVYYQGVNVGKVPKVGFSDDLRHTYIYVDIYRELALPKNVDAVIKTQGLTGTRYINLSYPQNPSDELLVNGDIIKGQKPLDLEDLQQFIQVNVENGRFEKIFNNMENTIANANTTAQKIGETTDNFNSLIQTAKIGTSEFTETMGNLNKVAGSRVIQEEVTETVKNANGLLRETRANTQHIFDQIEQNRAIPRMTCAFDDAGQAARRFDCVNKNLSQMLNQRFLLFKLMFGNPGEPLSNCGNNTCP